VVEYPVITLMLVKLNLGCGHREVILVSPPLPSAFWRSSPAIVLAPAEIQRYHRTKSDTRKVSHASSVVVELTCQHLVVGLSLGLLCLLYPSTLIEATD